MRIASHIPHNSAVVDDVWALRTAEGAPDTTEILQSHLKFVYSTHSSETEGESQDPPASSELPKANISLAGLERDELCAIVDTFSQQALTATTPAAYYSVGRKLIGPFEALLNKLRERSNPKRKVAGIEPDKAIADFAMRHAGRQAETVYRYAVDRYSQAKAITRDLAAKHHEPAERPFGQEFQNGAIGFWFATFVIGTRAPATKLGIDLTLSMMRRASIMCGDAAVSAHKVRHPSDDVGLFPWLPAVYKLVNANAIDDAMDKMLWEIDELFYARRFDDCDRLLGVIDTSKLEINLLTGILAKTRIAASELRARAPFQERVVRLLEATESPERIALLLGGTTT